MSQKDMAERIGYDQTYISALEKGIRTMSRKFIERFAEAFPGGDIGYISGLKEWPGIPGGANFVHYELIPLINRHKLSEYFARHKDISFRDDLPKLYIDNIPEGNYWAFEVVSDEMSDRSDMSIIQGDVIVCSPINKEKAQYLTPGKFYVIHTSSAKLITMKLKEVTDKALILEPLNRIYDNCVVLFNDIEAIFNIYELHTKRHAL